jgi:hypothetical protein
MRILSSRVYSGGPELEHVHGPRVGASAVTIKTPTVVTKSDLEEYVDKLEPFVEAFNSDVKTKTYNVSSEPVAKTISIARKDGATDDQITQEVNLSKTWNGWGFMDSSTLDPKPEHPGYYRAWNDMSEKIKAGDYSSIWPWLVFGPAAGVFMVPSVIYGYAADSAKSRGSAWNNIREAHQRLALLRQELIDLGYKPSGGELPDVPGDVGLFGIGPLGDVKGKGAAQSWYETLPIKSILVVTSLFAGAMLLAQVRGLFK